jgi:cytochrome c
MSVGRAVRRLAGCLGVAGLVTAATASAAQPDAALVWRGAQAYEARCGGCHAVAAHRIGPLHAGVLGRRAGSAPGFDYSPALAASRIVWDTATLERWLTDPEAVIPGQRMGYRLGDAALRADIVAFLATLRPMAVAKP